MVCFLSSSLDPKSSAYTTAINTIFPQEYEYAYYRPGDSQAYQEMRQKFTRDAFFRLGNELQMQRPASVATEFVDTDWDEEIMSEAEDNSPRVSLQSVSAYISLHILLDRNLLSDAPLHDSLASRVLQLCHHMMKHRLHGRAGDGRHTLSTYSSRWKDQAALIYFEAQQTRPW